MRAVLAATLLFLLTIGSGCLSAPPAAAPDAFHSAPATVSESAQERADRLLAEPFLGRSPNGWLAWVHDDLALVPRDAAPSAPSLASAVQSLYAAYGFEPTLLDAAQADAALLQVPAAGQPALAALVQAVADAAAVQAQVAPAVAARMPASSSDAPAMTMQERDQAAALSERIVHAMGVLVAQRGQLPVAAATCLAPVGADCLAWLGSSGPDTYAPGSAALPDPALIVDPAGDDTYTNGAGGANPTGLLVPGNGLAASVVLDLDGDDDYTYAGEPAVVQGSGSVGGIGILADAWGQDLYKADFVRTTTGPPLLAGSVGLGYLDGGAQGTGYAGVGLLIDAWGDDVYNMTVASTSGRCIWGFMQGFGGAGGLGVASDAWGVDAWESQGIGITGGSDCWGLGSVDDAFQGTYPQGVGIYAGVGIMTDTGMGADLYYNTNESPTVDFYGVGFGAFAGLGVLADDGGNDYWYSYEKASNSWIDPTLNCAYGTGSLGGAGVFLDLGGDDIYIVETVSDVGAETMMEGAGEPVPGYGLFVDLDGTDWHEAIATPGPGHSGAVYGRGELDTGHNLVGTYVDAGSDTDTYLPAGFGANNAQWLFGIDL